MELNSSEWGEFHWCNPFSSHTNPELNLDVYSSIDVTPLVIIWTQSYARIANSATYEQENVLEDSAFNKCWPRECFERMFGRVENPLAFVFA